MSENLLNLAVTQYSTNLLLNLQQRTSRLRGKVMEGFHYGKMASPVDYVQPVAMRAPAGQFAPLVRTDTDFQRRWVTPVDKELTQMVDKFDKLRLLEDPQNAYTQGAASAVAREWDDRIIARIFGDAQTGVDNGGLSTETWASFSAAYEVADTFGNGSTSIGFTVDKLIEAQRIMEHNHVLEEEMQPGDKTLVVGSWQHAEMKKLIEIVSSEYKFDAVIRNGNVDSFLGWNVIVSERLNVATNIRDCIAFVKSGVYLGIWLDMENVISQRTDLSGHPWQLYTSMSSGATRLEPARVIKIKCGGDTSGADPTVIH